jgi:hypothetical protein
MILHPFLIALAGDLFFCILPAYKNPAMKITCLSFFFIVVIAGCQKKGNDGSNDICQGIANASVHVNSPVQAGTGIQLTAGNISGALYYQWDGPAGFSSTDQNPTINNAQPVNAGKYSVRIGFTGGCVRTAKTDSVVITVAPAPCSPSTNTASVDGVADISFYSVTGAPSGGSYFITANGTGGDVELEFPGTAKPGPGVYNIQPLGGEWLAGDVRLRAVSQSSNFPAAQGKVYVTVASNKVTAVFCSIPVTSHLISIQR